MTPPLPHTERADLWRLLRRGFGFAACIAAPCAAVLALPGVSRNDYVGAMADKIRRLETVASPKMVLVSGSSGAFSVDSRILSDAFGLPVVNMGLHAALGLRFLLLAVEPRVHRGDVVVLSLESRLFYESSREGDAVLYEALSYLPDPDHYLRSPLESVRYRLILAHLRLKTNTRDLARRLTGKPLVLDPVYRRDAFDAAGDCQGHVGLPSRFDSVAWSGRTPVRAEKLDASVLRALRQFVNTMETRRVRVLIVYPARAEIAYRRDAANVAALDSALRATLPTGVIFVGHPADALFPASDFFDTQYHMLAAKRPERTRLLVRQLAPYLPLAAPAAAR